MEKRKDKKPRARYAHARVGSQGGNPDKATNRKKDKRSIATEAAIEEQLLAKLKSTRFHQLTVSEICREAQITRATFYQHYGSLADVLDELLDDMMEELGDVPFEMCESCSAMNQPPSQERIWKGMPLCHFFASGNRYRALLEDNAIAERLVARIVDGNLDKMMAALRSRFPETKVDRAQLRYFNIFRISGCLAAVKAAERSGYDWSLVQPTLDGAIAAAFSTLK